MKHHFTVDVEEYFHVSALEPYVPRANWDRLPRRAMHSMERLLGLLDEHGARCTCFVLGWLAQKEPRLVRMIADAGHEVASHGWDHCRVTRTTPQEFRKSVQDAKRLLEDQAGAPVVGFRAPSFSIVRGHLWALEILIEEGYRYDSSLFPVRRSEYGFAGGRQDAYWVQTQAGQIAELPPCTLDWRGIRLPAAGGAYFRLFPYSWVASGIRSAEARGQSATFYIHPWEWDPHQPRIKVPWPTRVRHYSGLEGTWGKLRRLVSTFGFTSIVDNALPLPNTAPVVVLDAAVAIPGLAGPAVAS